jgi:uncharacterized pyridoxal phosphate-containing UPF0001 family protein
MISRRAELAVNLTAVRERVTAAALDCGRDPGELTLVVVTKYFPAADVRLLWELGVRDFGENRDQEAGPKFQAVRAGDLAPTVHFIGQVQSNKAASVAAYADVVHAVDRAKLVHALEAGAARAHRRLRVLVQVDLDTRDRPSATVAPGAAPAGPAGRGGAHPAQIAQLAALIETAEHLSLSGLMAVAPLGVDPREAFAELHELAQRLRADHPQANWLSSGMSGDLEAAVRHGATHLRVGTAILGSRPALR